MEKEFDAHSGPFDSVSIPSDPPARVHLFPCRPRGRRRATGAPSPHRRPRPRLGEHHGHVRQEGAEPGRRTREGNGVPRDAPGEKKKRADKKCIFPFF